MDALPIGTGHVDLTAYLHGTGGVGSFGGALDYEQRISRGVSAFANGWVGLGWDQAGRGLSYGALAGVRWTF